ncbi:MAG: hypothetical protein OEY14_04390, partial [Myxococcales bacterium]|nr:hypothetical protein [Myxococcales bacterium]
MNDPRRYLDDPETAREALELLGALEEREGSGAALPAHVRASVAAHLAGLGPPSSLIGWLPKLLAGVLGAGVLIGAWGALGPSAPEPTSAGLSSPIPEAPAPRPPEAQAPPSRPPEAAAEPAAPGPPIEAVAIEAESAPEAPPEAVPETPSGTGATAASPRPRSPARHPTTPRIEPGREPVDSLRAEAALLEAARGELRSNPRLALIKA